MDETNSARKAFSIRKLTPSEIGADLSLLAIMQDAQHIVGARCLQSDFDVIAETIAHENADEVFYVGVRDANSNEALGFYGVEIADDLQRGWLRGPFVAADHLERFDDVSNTAFDAILARAGARVHTWDAYVETTHQRAIAWLMSRCFISLKVNSVYTAVRTATTFSRNEKVKPPAPHLIDAVVALTQEAFPGGYLTRDDFAAPPSDESITLVATEANRLLGCVHASREPEHFEAHVDYLVVAKEARGRGIGRELLRSALAWAFAQAGVAQVALVVVEGNTNAVSLYESAGFKLTGVGQHLRLKTHTESLSA